MVKWPGQFFFEQKVLHSIGCRIPGSSILEASHQFLQRNSSKSGPMAACMSVFVGVQKDGFCTYGPGWRRNQASVFVEASSGISSRTSDYCSRVAGSLSIGRHCGDAVLPRHALSDATVFSRERGCCMKPHRKEFHLSCSSSFSAGWPADVSIESTVNEERLEASTTSVDLTANERQSLKLVSGSCYLPHPEKEETGGEDAHFICTEEHSIGVADGVGGWMEHGVNSGIYAQQLMSHSAAAIKKEPMGSIDPKRVLKEAHSLTRVLGSSTACIIVLLDKGIRAANLGDSGFIVVRDGATVFQSPPQQHGFNFPYQLEFGRTADLPSSAEVFDVEVAAGDVIVAGTDGLFDNLFCEEISALVGDALQSGLSPNETAQKIARVTQLRAMDRKSHTPFSAAAKKAGFHFKGGKLDDITVVVSYVA